MLTYRNIVQGRDWTDWVSLVFASYVLIAGLIAFFSHHDPFGLISAIIGLVLVTFVIGRFEDKGGPW